MGRITTLLGGLGVGAGLMYLFDPDRGRARRARLYDKSAHFSKQLRRAWEITRRDVTQRAYGLLAEWDKWLHQKQVSDAQLVERVRARLGRLVSHPRAIRVSAEQGRVTLSGPVLTHESGALLAGIAAVPGVSGIENQLEPHDDADSIPSLQGGGRAPAPRNWSPTARLFGAGSGSALLAYGVKHGGLLGRVVMIAGLALLARGMGMQTARAPGGGARPAQPPGAEPALRGSEIKH